MMTTVMQPYAGRVRDASGPAEANAIIDECPGLELVLTDVVMRDGTGFDVLEHVMARPDPKPPVILVTAYPADSAVQRAIRLGALDYLPKPTTIRRILRSFEFRGMPEPEDRQQPRWRCTGQAVLIDPSTESDAYVTWDIYNLSPNGAFIETKGPIPVGTEFELQLMVGSELGRVHARVARVQHPSWIDVAGVGVVFVETDEGADRILATCTAPESAG
jgi:CheY-like chemotaxis protein